jgi:hypothetical protein
MTKNAQTYFELMLRDVKQAVANGEYKSYDMEELVEVFGSRALADHEL